MVDTLLFPVDEAGLPSLDDSNSFRLSFHTSQLPHSEQAGSSADNPILIDDNDPSPPQSTLDFEPIEWWHGYRYKSKPTTEDERSRIRTLKHFADWPPERIADALNLTVRQVRYALIAKPANRPRGRPHTHPDDIAEVVFSLINTPRKTKRTMTYRRLADLHPELLPYSAKVIRSAMLAAGYQRLVQPSCIPLSPKIRQARLQFALRWQHLLPEDWYHWVWTDESWFNGLAAGRRFVTLAPGEDVREFAKARFKPNGWMFWGCFAGDRKGPGLIWEKKWGKINSESYRLHVLPLLRGFWADTHAFVIQQDNAPAHAAKATKQHFLDYFFGVHIAEWPPHSPDLNPIEHVWAWMKAWIENQPGPRLTGKKLRAAVDSAWQAVPASMLTKLYKSMPRRLAAVIAANGGYTGM